jgi:hypothetical protein
MRSTLMAFAAASIGSTVVVAATPLTPAEEEKVKLALQLWGCSGGNMGKEVSGIFEVDDAKCKGGQYDIKLDQEFRVISITRD